jgi:serine/threonine-protein phosphatase 6 regulatory ankyrin repeat subunit A/serine/threonine-protein phosphatase 6 regulatory ankyrin repeat subunit B
MLHRACYEGNVALAQRLIEAGANVNLQGPVNKGDTPLMLAIAANSNRLPLSQMLVAHGANVNLTDKSGRTALDIAVLYGQIPIAKLLLNHGASINAPDKEGHRPLSYAGVWTMNKPMKDFLIERGAR